MNVTGKPVPTSVGIFFIGFALIAAAFIFPGAKEAQSATSDIATEVDLMRSEFAILNSGKTSQN